MFALKDIPSYLYNHFMCLVVAISILENNNLIQLYADYAHALLKTFVQQCEYIYGRECLVYNLHGLLHLAEDAKRHGPLTENSAFNFETFNCTFAKYIRARKKPLTEFSNRYYESINVFVFWFNKIESKISTYLYKGKLIIIDTQ